MKILNSHVPRHWVFAAILVIAVVLTFRARSVMALNGTAEAEAFLDRAHQAYTEGNYTTAFEAAEAAVDEAPDTPHVLIEASDYAFVLGMSRFEPGEFWHVEAFEAGLDYATRAHEAAPDDSEVHRAWAEGLLLSYLYEIRIDPGHVKDSWLTLPVTTYAEAAYRDTGLRLAGKAPERSAGSE